MEPTAPERRHPDNLGTDPTGAHANRVVRPPVRTAQRGGRTQRRQAVYLGLLELGDTILAMDLSHG